MITGNTYPHEPFRTYGGGEKIQSFLYAEAIWFWETNRHQCRIENVDIKLQTIDQHDQAKREPESQGYRRWFL